MANKIAINSGRQVQLDRYPGMGKNQQVRAGEYNAFVDEYNTLSANHGSRMDAVEATGILNTDDVTATTAATITLTAAQTGGTFLFDRTAGAVYTLPTAAAGLRYTFITSVSNTSATNGIEGATSADLMVGHLINIDTDTSNAVAAWTPNGTSHYKITGNTGTTSLLKGSIVRVIGLGTNLWLVDGVTHSSGTVATPFA